MRSFYGNFGVLVRAYTYIRALGADGLRARERDGGAQRQLLLEGIRDLFDVPYDRRCMHEFVVSGDAAQGARRQALDIAKRLLDYGFHPPTMYFPLIVDEALMIEPTETESQGGAGPL